MASYIHKLCDAPYGLRNGQVRGTERVVHNGGWFNRQWQKIGWGDLAEDDFVKIAKAIPFGELFVVLSERTPILISITGDYCMENCSWLVEHGWAYQVDRHAEHDDPIILRRSVRFRKITSSSVRHIVERIYRVNIA
jgi:hypothetical protein